MSQVLQIHFDPSVDPKGNLSPEARQTLRELIREWKPEATDHWYFGRDKPNEAPSGNSWVRHVHLQPTSDDAALARWEASVESDAPPHSRTSDAIMFYSLCPNEPYKHGMLVIRVQYDPGGHAIFKDNRLLGTWEAIAYNHQVKGELPRL